MDMDRATKLQIANMIATSSSLNMELVPEKVDANAKHSANLTPKIVSAEYRGVFII